MHRMETHEPLGVSPSFLDLGVNFLHEAWSSRRLGHPEGEQICEDMPNETLPGESRLGEDRTRRPGFASSGGHVTRRMGQEPDRPDSGGDFLGGQRVFSRPE